MPPTNHRALTSISTEDANTATTVPAPNRMQNHRRTSRPSSSSGAIPQSHENRATLIGTLTHHTNSIVVDPPPNNQSSGHPLHPNNLPARQTTTLRHRMTDPPNPDEPPATRVLQHPSLPNLRARRSTARDNLAQAIAEHNAFVLGIASTTDPNRDEPATSATVHDTGTDADHQPAQYMHISPFKISRVQCPQSYATSSEAIDQSLGKQNADTNPPNTNSETRPTRSDDDSPGALHDRPGPHRATLNGGVIPGGLHDQPGQHGPHLQAQYATPAHETSTTNPVHRSTTPPSPPATTPVRTEPHSRRSLALLSRTPRVHPETSTATPVHQEHHSIQAINIQHQPGHSRRLDAQSTLGSTTTQTGYHKTRICSLHPSTQPLHGPPEHGTTQPSDSNGPKRQLPITSKSSRRQTSTSNGSSRQTTYPPSNQDPNGGRSPSSTQSLKGTTSGPTFTASSLKGSTGL